MADTRAQQPVIALTRERPAPASRPQSAPAPGREDSPRSVTPYDEIWFQGRPQLP
jgi:hypothetical protein